jgi:hypothetical protein
MTPARNKIFSRLFLTIGLSLSFLGFFDYMVRPSSCSWAYDLPSHPCDSWLSLLGIIGVSILATQILMFIIKKRISKHV